MKKKIDQLKIAGFLTFAIICFGINTAFPVTAQTVNRQRVITKQPPTPTPTPSPAQTPLKPAVSATPQIAANQPLTDLQTRIRAILSRPEIQRGQVGLKIVSLDSGRTIFEENAEKYFMPASNMKNFTVAAAIEKLSPNFRFVTSVYAPVKPDANGTIKGDLAIYGRGDVSFSAAFNDGDDYKGLDALAQKIVDSGVKRIEGNLVGDESYFTGFSIPAGWEWDDLQWYYGAEISSLGVADNSIALSITPGAVNDSCFIQTLPVNTIMKIVNRCVTSASNEKRDIQIFKQIDRNTLEVSGTVPAGDKGFKGAVAISHPSELFVEMLRGLLLKKGVVITGQNRIVGAKEKAISAVASSVPPIEIARLESPPLSLIAANTLKPSQNLYTETILWTLGEQGRNFSPLTAPNPYLNQKSTSAEKGLFVVQNFLREIGIAPDSVLQYDGSGLSRHNLVTPSSLVQLYTYMARSRNANVWRDALTIAGVDGTLRNRFKGTKAAGNVRGKTGSLDQVATLSGYVTSSAGEQFVFSILANDIPDLSVSRSIIDDIVVSIAEFNGKTNQDLKVKK